MADALQATEGAPEEASPALDQQTLIDSPLPPESDGLQENGPEEEEEKETRGPRDITPSRHVSSSNDEEEIQIILHGAANLPATSQSRPPKAFAIVKTKSEEDRSSAASIVTSFKPTPAFSTSWNAFGVVRVDERRATEEVLIFKVVDGPTKQVLARYHLPVDFLEPFHPYHLEMVVPSVSSSQGVILIVSITRKLSCLPKTDSSANYIGLEVLLQHWREELEQPIGPITAVAKIISSYYPYREDLLSRHQLGWNHVFGVTATTVLFPNPQASLFKPPIPYMAGAPQVTLPGQPEKHPVWNHCYLFINDRDRDTLFSPHCALLIEFYRTRSGMTDLTWRLMSPLGYCVIPLDHDMYRSLTPSATRETTAAKIEALPIKNCLLLTVDKKVPTVDLVLRLITTQRPDSLKDLVDTEDLPVISINQQLMDPPIDLPSHDAMERILDSKEQQKNKKKRSDHSRDFVPWSPGAKVDGTEGSPSSTDILDFQLNELNAYRDAVRRMERDILSLHEQVRLLQATNFQLQKQIETGVSLGTPFGGDGVEAGGERGSGKTGRLRKEADYSTDDARLVDRTEVEERYELMMKRVNRQNIELKEYREKVLKLQNELIQKNEKEKAFLRKSKSLNENPSKELEKQLEAKKAKIRGLEEAYRNQEKIIDKMETLLEAKNKGDKERHIGRDKIIEENQRLRVENQTLIEQHRLMSKYQKDEEEILELRQKLDRDEERIRSLEHKLVENARRWGHEKTDLQTRLEEAEMGFRRTSILDSGRPFIQMDWPSVEDRTTPPTDSRFKDTKRLPRISTH